MSMPLYQGPWHRRPVAMVSIEYFRCGMPWFRPNATQIGVPHGSSGLVVFLSRNGTPNVYSVFDRAYLRSKERPTERNHHPYQNRLYARRSSSFHIARLFWSTDFFLIFHVAKMFDQKCWTKRHIHYVAKGCGSDLWHASYLLLACSLVCTLGRECCTKIGTCHCSKDSHVEPCWAPCSCMFV